MTTFDFRLRINFREGDRFESDSEELVLLVDSGRPENQVYVLAHVGHRSEQIREWQF